MRGRHDGYFKYKRNNQTCNFWDFQGNEINEVSISVAFSVDILIRNENIDSEEHKAKNCSK